MKTQPPTEGTRSPSTDDEITGLPGLRTWRAVYVFVFLAFAVVVAALAIFERVYA